MGSAICLPLPWGAGEDKNWDSTGCWYVMKVKVKIRIKPLYFPICELFYHFQSSKTLLYSLNNQWSGFHFYAVEVKMMTLWAGEGIPCTAMTTLNVPHRPFLLDIWYQYLLNLDNLINIFLIWQGWIVRLSIKIDCLWRTQKHFY